MRVVIQFARFGPYHIARMNAASRVLASFGIQVVGLESAGCDETYDWDRTHNEQNWERRTALPHGSVESSSAKLLRKSIWNMLDEVQPSVVIIPGWGSVDARASLQWCRRHDVKTIVMSETRAADGVRVWWKEWFKSRIIKQFDVALVGGQSHKDYLIQLGMPRERIFSGYNVVDNAYFYSESTAWKSKNNVRQYFLASNRFIERKNLKRLIQAYAHYVSQCNESYWDLCLVGDGELKQALLNECKVLGLSVLECAPWEQVLDPRAVPTVFFPGFRQIEELPRFYAHAGCFVHPAEEEPWGLVINEAMAAGLPVLSSRNVGAAEELVDEGMNGFLFEALNTDAIATQMEKISSLPENQYRSMTIASQRIINERADTNAFGEGLVQCLSKMGVLEVSKHV